MPTNTLLLADLLPAELAASLGNEAREGLRGPKATRDNQCWHREPHKPVSEADRLQCWESSPGKAGKPEMASEPPRTPVETEGAPPHWEVMPDLPSPPRKTEM